MLELADGRTGRCEKRGDGREILRRNQGRLGIAVDPVIAMYDEPFAGLDPISVNVISELIRVTNTALGATSIVVSYDVTESLKVADYVYVIGDGLLAGEGTPEAMAASKDPFLRQFFDALPDGPIEFHYPSRPYFEDLGLKTSA